MAVVPSTVDALLRLCFFILPHDMALCLPAAALFTHSPTHPLPQPSNPKQQILHLLLLAGCHSHSPLSYSPTARSAVQLSTAALSPSRQPVVCRPRVPATRLLASSVRKTGQATGASPQIRPRPPITPACTRKGVLATLPPRGCRQESCVLATLSNIPTQPRARDSKSPF